MAKRPQVRVSPRNAPFKMSLARRDSTDLDTLAFRRLRRPNGSRHVPGLAASAMLISGTFTGPLPTARP